MAKKVVKKKVVRKRNLSDDKKVVFRSPSSKEMEDWYNRLKDAQGVVKGMASHFKSPESISLIKGKQETYEDIIESYCHTFAKK